MGRKGEDNNTISIRGRRDKWTIAMVASRKGTTVEQGSIVTGVGIDGVGGVGRGAEGQGMRKLFWSQLHRSCG